ncbi:uncharacterized protein METZ01_LOCUS503611, partial [marine metagenome]
MSLKFIILVLLFSAGISLSVACSNDPPEADTNAVESKVNATLTPLPSTITPSPASTPPKTPTEEATVNAPSLNVDQSEATPAQPEPNTSSPIDRLGSAKCNGSGPVKFANSPMRIQDIKLLTPY